jgi:hypothetical protein
VRGAFFVGGWFGVLLFGASSNAASLASLDYDAPWECLSRDYFWQALWSRSVALAQPCEPGSPCRDVSGRDTASPRIVGALRMRIRRVGESYSGIAQLRDDAGAITERRVTGQVCVDVVQALALATAVVLDASIDRGKVGGLVPKRPQHFELSLGTAFGLHTAAQPSLSPTLGIIASVRVLHLAASPLLRFEALLAHSRPVWDEKRLAQAQFGWFSTRTSVCPFVTPTGALGFGACGVVELGALRGEGITGMARQTQTGLWLAPGAFLLGSLRHENLGLRLASGFVVPVVRDRFVFAPDSQVFRPPSLGLAAEFEVAYTFDG